MAEDLFAEQQNALSFLTPPNQYNPFDNNFGDPFRMLNPTNELPLMVAPTADPRQQLSGMGFGPGPAGLTAGLLTQPVDNPQSLYGSSPQFIPHIPGYAGGPVAGKLGLETGIPAPRPAEAPLPGFETTVQEDTPTGIGIGQPPIESPFQAPSVPGGGDSQLWRQAISSIESGSPQGNYGTLGSIMTRGRYRGDRAYGRYQVMGLDIPRLTQTYVGRQMSPQEFLASPAAQDAVFDGEFGRLVRRFGNPVDAAQAWFAGEGSVGNPRALDLTDAHNQSGQGISVREYRARFERALGRGVTGPATQRGLTDVDYIPGEEFQQLADPQAGINPSTVLPGLGAMNAMAGQPTGLGQPPAPTVPPFSPTASALVPGLGRAPTGPQPGVARMGIQGIGDVLGWSGLSQGRPMTSPADFFGHLPVRQQQAATEVFVRGQELRMENPTATADQLMQMLIRDPVWGRNAISIGPNPVAVIQAAVNPPPPAPGGFTLNPGDTRYGPDGRPIAQAPPRVPDQAALVQWLQSLPPEQRQEAMTMLTVLRARMPSDRAQSQARVEAIEAAGGVAPINDLLALGRIRPITRVNQFGNPEVIGYQDVATGRPYGSHSPTIAGQGQVPPPGQPVGAVPTQPSGPPPLEGGVGANIPPIPSLQGVTAPDGTPTGFTIGQQPWQPGQPIPPELRSLYEQGAFAPGAMSMNLFQPTVGGQPITPRTEGAAPPPSRPSEMPAPGPIDTTLRRFRFGEREYNDAPGLSYSTSQLSDPAEMFLAVGAGPLARQFMGRIAGQLPKLATTEEASTARAAALDNLRAVFATYQQGSRQLRGEFEATMAGIPSPGEILSSPTRAFQQAITLRERVLADYQLALGQAQNMGLPQSARTAAAERAARAQAVLQAMPSMEQLFNMQEVVRRGQATGTTVPSLGEVTGTTSATIKGVTGSDTPAPGTARIPPDLTDTTRLPSARLVGMAKQPGVSDDDLRRIQAELQRRTAVEKGTRAPLPPRSE